MSKFYTEEMRQYLLKNYKGKTARQIQEEFNCKFNTNITYHAMKSYLGKNNIKLGRNNNRKFRDVHIQFLKENVKGITLKELTNRFNKEFNMSPITYYNNQRLELSIKYLLEKKNAREICALINFASPAAFNKAFKIKYGLPPERYVETILKKH